MPFNYSIIIPHRNIPILLQRCLKSIPQRDDIQIIIVDDNSNPAIANSPEFPGKKRNNTEIIFTKENKGAGFARNVGLKHAKGEWILFADADDFFCENLLDKIDQFKDSLFNVIYFKTTCRESSNTNKIGMRQKLCNQFNNIIDEYNSENIDFRKTILSFGTPWGKLVRKKFLDQNGILFEEVPYSNDIRWMTLVAIYCKKENFICSCATLYCLTDRENSLYHTNNHKALACRFSVFLGQYTLLKKNGYTGYTNFQVPDYIKKARLLGLLKFISFLGTIINSSKEIPLVYSIEKKIHLKKPYIYFFIQTVEQILHIAPRP